MNHTYAIIGLQEDITHQQVTYKSTSHSQSTFIERIVSLNHHTRAPRTKRHLAEWRHPRTWQQLVLDTSISSRAPAAAKKPKENEVQATSQLNKKQEHKYTNPQHPTSIFQKLRSTIQGRISSTDHTTWGHKIDTQHTWRVNRSRGTTTPSFRKWRPHNKTESK